MTAAPLLSIPDLGLTVAAGETVAVVGPSAPALWERLAGAEGRPAGPVLYKGTDISSWSPARRRAGGLLALFERPRAPAGMTLGALLRPARVARRSSLRLAAGRLGVPAALLDKPLDAPEWADFGAHAEWLQACALAPALVVSAAPPVRAALELLKESGAGLVLTARSK